MNRQEASGTVRLASQHMCPHCGAIVKLAPSGLVVEHLTTAPLEQCAGSGQNPRNPLSDRRPLWNGKPNPHGSGEARS